MKVFKQNVMSPEIIEDCMFTVDEAASKVTLTASIENGDMEFIYKILSKKRLATDAKVTEYTLISGPNEGSLKSVILVDKFYKTIIKYYPKRKDAGTYDEYRFK